MSIEIERKFLLKNDKWKKYIDVSLPMVQGYLASDNGMTVRVRVVGQKAYLTIKGKRDHYSRSEFEYAIPVKDAKEMLGESQCIFIKKVRHIVFHDNNRWEVDVFKGENKGLSVAELELNSEDQDFSMPSWIGEEVSEDSKYRNSRLARNPFKTW